MGKEQITGYVQPEGEIVVIAGKKYRVVSFPDSFFKETREYTQRFFGKSNGQPKDVAEETVKTEPAVEASPQQ